MGIVKTLEVTLTYVAGAAVGKYIFQKFGIPEDFPDAAQITGLAATAFLHGVGSVFAIGPYHRIGNEFRALQYAWNTPTDIEEGPGTVYRSLIPGLKKVAKLPNGSDAVFTKVYTSISRTKQAFRTVNNLEGTIDVSFSLRVINAQQFYHFVWEGGGNLGLVGDEVLSRIKSHIGRYDASVLASADRIISRTIDELNLGYVQDVLLDPRLPAGPANPLVPKTFGGIEQRYGIHVYDISLANPNFNEKSEEILLLDERAVQEARAELKQALAHQQQLNIELVTACRSVGVNYHTEQETINNQSVEKVVFAPEDRDKVREAFDKARHYDRMEEIARQSGSTIVMDSSKEGGL